MRIPSFLILLSILAILGCSPPEKQKVPQVDFSAIEALLHTDNDTVYVVNFWATWCKPCVEELPEFEKLNQEYKNKKVKIILVSLDFPSNYDKQLLPFIEKNNIRCKVIHLTELNANAWINKVHPEWSGAIPATLIFRGKTKDFYEQKLSYQELKIGIERKL